MLKQSLMEAFEELLDERNMLKLELTSLIEEQRKEIEVNVYIITQLRVYVSI